MSVKFSPTCLARSFSPQRLTLVGVAGDARDYLYDVSEDGLIACAIKTTSWATTSSKKGSGKVESLWKEIYFLSISGAQRKILVLTDGVTFESFGEESAGRLMKEIELLHCQLTPDLYKKLAETKDRASAELRPITLVRD